ncbi:MAG: hypothetical protein GC192_22880 [Bacteroidetes bacterium]|nr:hypothetical protein [Bacteroidota bacterium]
MPIKAATRDILGAYYGFAFAAGWIALGACLDILGAYHGFAALPDFKREVIWVNKELLGNDLEALAKDLTELVCAGMEK